MSISSVTNNGLTIPLSALSTILSQQNQSTSASGTSSTSSQQRSAAAAPTRWRSRVGRVQRAGLDRRHVRNDGKLGGLDDSGGRQHVLDR